MTYMHCCYNQQNKHVVVHVLHASSSVDQNAVALWCIHYSAEDIADVHGRCSHIRHLLSSSNIQTCYMYDLLCHADASPQEVSTALMSAGSWGLVHEPTASGPLNANALAGTNNVLLNADMFHALDLQPERLQVGPGLTIPSQTMASKLSSACTAA